MAKLRVMSYLDVGAPQYTTDQRDASGVFVMPDIYSQRDWYLVAFDEKGEMNSVILSGVKT